MGNARCFHHMNPSGSISSPHISCCFTAFSYLGWEWASSCSQLRQESYFISGLQLCRAEGLGRQLLLALGQPHTVRAGMRMAKSALGCWAAVSRDKTTQVWVCRHSMGSNRSRWNDAGGAGKLLQAGFKGRELLSAVGRSSAVRGHLWKDRILPAGTRVRAHPHPVGQWHCRAAAVVIHSVLCTHLVSHTCGTIHVMHCQESESARNLPLINAISHFLHSI